MLGLIRDYAYNVLEGFADAENPQRRERKQANLKFLNYAQGGAAIIGLLAVAGIPRVVTVGASPIAPLLLCYIAYNAYKIFENAKDYYHCPLKYQGAGGRAAFQAQLKKDTFMADWLIDIVFVAIVSEA